MQESSNVMVTNKKQYVMFDLDAKDNDIWYFENSISCPNELVRFIEEMDSEEESYKRIPKWSEWRASDVESILYGYTKTGKSNIKELPIESKKIDQKTRYIINSLNMATSMCFDRYADGHSLDKSKYRIEDDIVNITKWNAGQDMGPHFDGQNGSYSLAFTMVSYLNDDYEGGEISFPNHNLLIKPKAGSVVIFPSSSEFIHEVKTIKNGTRYTRSCSVLMV